MMHIDVEATGQSNFSFRLDHIRIYAIKGASVSYNEACNPKTFFFS